MNEPETLSPAQDRDARIAKRLQVIGQDSPSKLKLFERVFAGTASPRQVIKAQCCECLNCDTEAIRTCTAPTCPLYLYRPFMKGGGL